MDCAHNRAGKRSKIWHYSPTPTKFQVGTLMRTETLQRPIQARLGLHKILRPVRIPCNALNKGICSLHYLMCIIPQTCANSEFAPILITYQSSLFQGFVYLIHPARLPNTCFQFYHFPTGGAAKPTSKPFKNKSAGLENLLTR